MPLDDWPRKLPFGSFDAASSMDQRQLRQQNEPLCTALLLRVRDLATWRLIEIGPLTWIRAFSSLPCWPSKTNARWLSFAGLSNSSNKLNELEWIELEAGGNYKLHLLRRRSTSKPATFLIWMGIAHRSNDFRLKWKYQEAAAAAPLAWNGAVTSYKHSASQAAGLAWIACKLVCWIGINFEAWNCEMIVVGFFSLALSLNCKCMWPAPLFYNLVKFYPNSRKHTSPSLRQVNLSPIKITQHNP